MHVYCIAFIFTLHIENYVTELVFFGSHFQPLVKILQFPLKMSTIREEEEQEKLNCANSTINNSKNCRCKGSDVICNLSQFLTLVVSLSTLVLLLLMTILAPVVVPNDDDGQNSQFVPPRPDVAIWLQQISGFTWMPSYFQVWSSELKNQHHNLTKIEGTQ